MNDHHPIVIAGVGNVLLSDDGVGVHVVSTLQREPMAGVAFVEIGTAILHGLSAIESAERVLVIDAARGGRPPGTIYLFDADDPLQLPSTSSIHAMGLREALWLLPPGTARPRITILGVEPQCLEWGTELSPPVKATLPQVMELARRTIQNWQNSSEAMPGTPALARDAMLCHDCLCSS